MYINISGPAIVQAIYQTGLEYGICTLDLNGDVTSWSIGAERMLGYSAEEVAGQYYGFMFIPEDVARGEPALEVEIARTKERTEDYRWHLRKDGSFFWTNGFMSLVHDKAGNHIGYLKMFQDRTASKLADDDMHHLAFSDKLTGLANRHFLEVQAKEKIASALRSGQPMALHLIDLDGFKRVNDTLGHQAGDAVLRQCAERMRRVIRENDFIARLGGDEFVILQVSMVSIAAGAELAVKLIKVMSEPFDIGEQKIQISASIGLAICPHDSIELDSLLKKADLALYRAKKQGKATYHYFTIELSEIAYRQEQKLGHLRYAINRKEFGIVYQPIISIKTNTVCSFEALLRCHHPGLQGVPVDQIIDLAVAHGLMKNLSYWMLSKACRQLRQWRDEGFYGVKLAVNLCSQDLVSYETVTHIDSVLFETGLGYEDLQIELTERQALEVEKHGIETLEALRSRGIGIALDDFGTGFSALSYLRNLPVTAIKIDKSFLIDIPSHYQGSELLKSIANLAKALNLQVVAEGVENEEQADFLRLNGCSEMQGYWISRPMHPEKMTQWMREYSIPLNH